MRHGTRIRACDCLEEKYRCDELREVHGCYAQDGFESFAKHPFPSVTLHAVLPFHVPDHRLYRRPSFH